MVAVILVEPKGLKITEYFRLTMKEDKSPQGFVDEDIKSLLKILNDQGYQTTSSCSGRIVLITRSGEKGSAKWIYKTHNIPDIEKIFSLIQEHSPVWFLQEPMILQVKANNLDSAQKLLTVAKNSGLKISGITSVRKCTLEIRGTERMETLLTKECNKDYVSLLVEEANKKLQKTKEKMKRLYSALI